MSRAGRTVRRSEIDEAAEHARRVLSRCVTPLGFRASATDDGYPEIWARDAMIVLLGVCAAGLDELMPAVRTTLDTLAARQSPLGRIPTSVRPDGRSGTANAVGVDSTLWFVIGERLMDRMPTADAPDLSRREVVERAMRWARFQDSDEDGLIESQEASGWADLIAYRGKVLYDNVLYLLALRSYAALADRYGLPDAALHPALADRVHARLNELLWVEAPEGLWDRATSPVLGGDDLESRRLAELTAVELWTRPFYLPWVGFRSFGDWCDVLGNSLAIIAGVADDRRSGEILDHFAAVGIHEPWPARALHPPIQPGDPDWRPYYRNGGLNLPLQYQNGGSWPFIGGFVICALVRAGRHQVAREMLERLAACVRTGRAGQWEFNEWYHGRTGHPMGRPLQAWSAAMYLTARRAVDDGRLGWLEGLGR